jgi:hypothetical protein
MSNYPIDPAILEAVLSRKYTKQAFVPAQDPLMAALGAGGAPGGLAAPPGGGAPPMPGGAVPPPPNAAPAGGMPLGGLPPIPGFDLGMGLAPGANNPPSGPGMPPETGLEQPSGQEGQTPGQGGQTPEQEVGMRRSGSKIVDMTEDDFRFMLKASMSDVVDTALSDLMDAIKKLTAEVQDLKAALSERGIGRSYETETEMRSLR